MRESTVIEVWPDKKIVYRKKTTYTVSLTGAVFRAVNVGNPVVSVVTVLYFIT